MTKKIGSNTVAKIIKAYTQDSVVLEYSIAKDKKCTVSINPYISFDQYCQAANDVANNCYDKNGDYHPEFFGLAYNVVLIENFTNIDISELADEDEDVVANTFKQIYALCETTDIISDIEKYVKCAAKISNDAKAIIESRNARKASPWDSVAYSIMDFLDKFSDSVDKHMDKFGDMKPDDVQNIIGLAQKLTSMDEKSAINNILDFQEAKSKK